MSCSRCDNPVCKPEQAPGSKSPCITCAQPYGDHCWSLHCRTQGMFFSDREKWKTMIEENKSRAGERDTGDEMEMCFKATGRTE